MLIEYTLIAYILIVFILALLGLAAYLMFKCHTEVDFNCGITCAVLAIIFIPLVCERLSNENQARWLMSHKPRCMDKTEECLEKRIDWYKDSIRVMTKHKKDERSKQRKLDSLQHVLNHFESRD